MSAKISKIKINRFLTIALCAASAVAVPLVPRCLAAASSQQSQPVASGTANRRIGAVKAINGTAITLTPDSGPDVNITVLPTTRILRIAPGEKDLKSATPIQLQDLQVGDRILVGGKPSDDNLSLSASTIVVMKHSDLEAQHQKDLQDWQKRGVGGLVTAVDTGVGTVTISVGSFAAKKSIVVHTTGTTMIRRYAPDSVKFDDAKPGTLQEIHPGDQVRARGDRSADGNELAADEIVSGSFRNIAGTVTSTDASSSTINVQDLLSKKSVVVKVTADSQLRRLPPEMAQRIAARLKAAALGGVSGTASSAGAAPSSGPSGGTGPGGNAAGGRPGGAPDFQQMLSRLPAVAVADLHKGDAVVILATEGTGGVGTVITLVGGVEPMLQAAPSASSAAMLAPWSMGAPSGDSGGP
jgi:hypothetical protein